MKPTLITLTVAVICFTLGWLAHRFVVTHCDHCGVQWQFVSAAGAGDVHRMEALLASGARVDDVPSFGGGQGYTALFTAASRGEVDAVRWLLDHGADPNHDTGDAHPFGAARHRATEASKAAELLQARGAK